MIALMFMPWAPDGHQATGMSALVWLQFDQLGGFTAIPTMILLRLCQHLSPILRRPI